MAAAPPPRLSLAQGGGYLERPWLMAPERHGEGEPSRAEKWERRHHHGFAELRGKGREEREGEGDDQREAEMERGADTGRESRGSPTPLGRVQGASERPGSPGQALAGHL